MSRIETLARIRKYDKIFTDDQAEISDEAKLLRQRVSAKKNETVVIKLGDKLEVKRFFDDLSKLMSENLNTNSQD